MDKGVMQRDISCEMGEAASVFRLTAESLVGNRLYCGLSVEVAPLHDLAGQSRRDGLDARFGRLIGPN